MWIPFARKLNGTAARPPRRVESDGLIPCPVRGGVADPELCFTCAAPCANGSSATGGRFTIEEARARTIGEVGLPL